MDGVLSMQRMFKHWHEVVIGRARPGGGGVAVEVEVGLENILSSSSPAVLVSN